MILRVRVKPNFRSSSLKQEADGSWRAQLKAPPVDGKANAELIALVAEHFQCSRAIFAKELARRGRPRCRSYVLCGIGGYALGLVTGLCGRASIAATTVAVEKVVLRHLGEQMVALRGVDAAAVSAIESILADEQSHHDRAALEPSQGIFWPKILRPIVSASTEAVIWLGMKL